MSQNIPLTISSWSLGDKCSFKERVSAAKDAGFEGIGLRAENYVDALSEGLSDSDMLEILKEYKMKVTEVEYIVQWAEEIRSYAQKYKEQICFHMCNLFGVKHVNCGLMETYSTEYTASKLRELCQRAGNLIIALEPMPYSGIPDVRTCWAILKEAGCENAGLLLDSWHWIRADQSYEKELLEGIPAESIISIQINDVRSQPYAKCVLRDESMHDRLLPGTGAGNTAGFLRMLKEKGVNPLVIGTEVISDEIVSHGISEAVKENYAAAFGILHSCWPETL